MSSNATKTSKAVKKSSRPRKSLKPIQSSASDNAILVRNVTPTKSENEGVKITKKETAEDVKKWLTEEKVEDIRYYKALAEERRKALEDALKENEKLKHENELLQAENRHLQKLADEGVRLGNLLQEIGIELDPSAESD